MQYLLDITLRYIATSAGSLKQYCDGEMSVHTVRIQSRISMAVRCISNRVAHLHR